MTKFFQDSNPPRVWNPVKNKVTVVFQAGEFETDDPASAELLVKAGYRYSGKLPERKLVRKPEPVRKPELVKKPASKTIKSKATKPKTTKPKTVKPRMVAKKK